MICLASLLLSCVPQVFPDSKIKLPPQRERPAAQAPMVRPISEIERFRRDVLELRGTNERVEQKLHEMAQGYAAPTFEALVVETARLARADELASLMVAIRRFTPASAKVGTELHFQVLSRPLGDATRVVLETMAAIKGPEAKAALQECVRGRVAGARRLASEALVPLLAAEDLPFVLQLSREQSLDLQLRAIELLRVVPADGAAARLVELLSRPPELAGSACSALVRMGTRAVPVLQQLMVEPPIDRGFAYAAFALAQIAQAGAPDVLPAAAAGKLAARLGDPEPLTRALCAVALADLAYRSTDPTTVFPDAAVVDALLEVVQPLKFVPNLDLLRQPAEDRLARLSGRLASSVDVTSWREWWGGQREGFVGLRAQVAIDAKNAAMATITWRNEGRHVRLLSSGLADVQPVQGAVEIVLTEAEMLDLIGALQRGGFADEVRMRVDTALPRVRSLQLQVPAGRMQVAMPVSEHADFDALAALVARRVDAEAWQQYRDARNEPERGAFWRAERAWLDSHPEPLDRARRLLGRVVTQWPGLGQAQRARALEFFATHAQRKQLLGEADGERIVAVLAAQPELQELDQRLLEFGATAPGDKVWRQAVELAARMKGGGRNAVRSVFAVLGPDAVLGSLTDANPLVRRAGIEEIGVVRDQRAAPRLIELLGDPDLEVRRAAVAVCGHMAIAAASRPLVALIAAEDTPALLRREALRALGRVGGDLAFPVLQRSLTAPDPEDKEAVLRGLGDLRDPRAAQALAELVVLSHGNDLGALARLHLQRQGGTLAIPALRAQLSTVQDVAIRNQLVLLVGAYHDPSVVPDLMTLLRHPDHAALAAQHLAGTTGVDLLASSERIDQIESWWQRYKQFEQWQWLLDALRAANVRTTLTVESFSATAGLAAVPELARLLVEAAEPRFWSMAAAVLRTVAKEDYGVVTEATSLEAREAVASRYRLLVEAARTAQVR